MFEHLTIGNLEDKLGLDLGYDRSKKVKDILRETGVPSLAKLLEMTERTSKK